MGLRMHRLNVQPTMACTLKCKLCNNLSPYYDTPPYHNIDCLKKELTTLFTLVDDIDILNISGGEPFLYRELDRLLHFLAENRNIIKKRLDIITNGTIIPDEKILCAIKAANASILLDDYGSERSKKAQQLKLLCEMENIDYRYRNYTSANPYFDGWLMSYERNKEPINEKEYVEFLHSKCMLVTGEQRPNIMMDGKLYICFCQYWLDDYDFAIFKDAAATSG